MLHIFIYCMILICVLCHVLCHQCDAQRLAFVAYCNAYTVSWFPGRPCNSLADKKMACVYMTIHRNTMHSPLQSLHFLCGSHLGANACLLVRLDADFK